MPKSNRQLSSTAKPPFTLSAKPGRLTSSGMSTPVPNATPPRVTSNWIASASVCSRTQPAVGVVDVALGRHEVAGPPVLQLVAVDVVPADEDVVFLDQAVAVAVLDD